MCLTVLGHYALNFKSRNVSFHIFLYFLFFSITFFKYRMTKWVIKIREKHLFFSSNKLLFLCLHEISSSIRNMVTKFGQHIVHENLTQFMIKLHVQKCFCQNISARSSPGKVHSYEPTLKFIDDVFIARSFDVENLFWLRSKDYLRSSGLDIRKLVPSRQLPAQS